MKNLAVFIVSYFSLPAVLFGESQGHIQNFEEIKREKAKLQQLIEEQENFHFENYKGSEEVDLRPDAPKAKYHFQDWSTKGKPTADTAKPLSPTLDAFETQVDPSKVERWLKNYFLGVVVGYRCLKQLITDLQWTRVRRDEAAVTCATKGINGCAEQVDTVYQKQIKHQLDEWKVCADGDGSEIKNSKVAERLDNYLDR